jgi:predicted transporter protein
MIQMIVTLPTLAICIMAPVYGWLSNRIQPRRLIIYGLLLFCIGGSLPVFLNNLPLIMICRVALGVGTGITLPAALAIIPVFYEGKKRDKLIGFNQAVGSIGCIFMQQIGGYFADIDWHLSFLAYLMGLFSLVLVLLFLPDIPMEKVLKTADKDRKSIFSCVSTKIYGLAGVLFVAMIFACIPTTNLSLMIEGEGIGTATNTGTAMAVYSVGTMLGSAAFGYMKKAVGIYVLPLSYFFNGAGFFGVAMSHSLMAVIMFLMLAGFGTGALLCAYLARAEELSRLAYVAFSVSMMAAANGLGNFIHPTFVSLCDSLFGGVYGRGAIKASGVSLAAMGMILLIIYLVTAKNRLNEKLLD